MARVDGGTTDWELRGVETRGEHESTHVKGLVGKGLRGCGTGYKRGPEPPGGERTRPTVGG